ncbi:serine hydrolase domain-containing protein [Saccharospirillum salsuginis]|uniref:6-aminohexanoate-dimer hydrolase n=1 Tax=Saccharospirillum salsuginis TaxID=418750 RepID=A0A918KHP7_9GAMM|nr:serine hydrolase [Saccharospirillum salsuginis]GGX63354.1 6-aminohexanoate-dimer hydrolase [Saccharospirillum salsuginis]
MNRYTAVATIPLVLSTIFVGTAVAEENPFSEAVRLASGFDSIRTLHIAQSDRLQVAESYNGASTDVATNVKSASKLLISALVGIAIERDILTGTDQPVADLLEDEWPADPNPLLNDLTVGHLLSMQAGLRRTSGRNYGAWVNSDNWVRNALNQPFSDVPGGDMLYSTGNTHLLSAILTRETGRSTYRLVNDWLGPAGVRVEGWMNDPQGIPLGGNQVSMTPESLLAFGELYRRGGKTSDGVQLIPAAWIKASWQPRAESRYTGDGYGYTWFIREFAGYPGYYGWGYGGQMLYVVPELELTVVITSDTDSPSGRTGYREALHDFLSEHIVPEAARRLDT